MEKLLYIDPHRVQDFHPPVLSSTAPNSWNQERAQPSAGRGGGTGVSGGGAHAAPRPCSCAWGPARP